MKPFTGWPHTTQVKGSVYACFEGIPAPQHARIAQDMIDLALSQLETELRKLDAIHVSSNVSLGYEP